MKRSSILLTLLISAAFGTGCGQKGPLRLPEPAREPAQTGGASQPSPGKAAPTSKGESK